MPLVTPDLSGVQDQVTPGTYKCTVKKGDIKESSNGSLYINWRLETYGESESKNNGRSIFIKTPLSGGGAFRLQQIYTAAMGKPLPTEFNTDELLGRKVLAEVVDGMDRNTNQPTGYTEVKKIMKVVE